MEEIEVTARTDTQGNITPLNFVWRSRTYTVDSIGRHWHAKDGYHILVLSTRNQAFHLIYKAEIAKWYLLHVGDVPAVSSV